MKKPLVSFEADTNIQFTQCPPKDGGGGGCPVQSTYWLHFLPSSVRLTDRQKCEFERMKWKKRSFSTVAILSDEWDRGGDLMGTSAGTVEVDDLLWHIIGLWSGQPGPGHTHTFQNCIFCCQCLIVIAMELWVWGIFTRQRYILKLKLCTYYKGLVFKTSGRL